MASYLMFINTEFIGSTNTINIFIISSTIYIVIPVSGCVGRAPVHCFAGKPVILLKRPCAALTWMKSYLNDRTQRVAVGSVVSNSMHLVVCRKVMS
jgi:hypothetical protein